MLRKSNGLLGLSFEVQRSLIKGGGFQEREVAAAAANRGSRVVIVKLYLQFK